MGSYDLYRSNSVASPISGLFNRGEMFERMPSNPYRPPQTRSNVNLEQFKKRFFSNETTVKLHLYTFWFNSSSSSMDDESVVARLIRCTGGWLHLLVFGNKLCKLRLIGPHHFIYLLSTLVEVESRHGLDGASSCDIIGIINIDLDEFSLGILLGKLLEDRTDEFTRTTPEEENREKKTSEKVQDKRQIMRTLNVPGGCEVNDHKLCLGGLKNSVVFVHVGKVLHFELLGV